MTRTIGDVVGANSMVGVNAYMRGTVDLPVGIKPSNSPKYLGKSGKEFHAVWLDVTPTGYHDGRRLFTWVPFDPSAVVCCVGTNL